MMTPAHEPQNASPYALTATLRDPRKKIREVRGVTPGMVRRLLRSGWARVETPATRH